MTKRGKKTLTIRGSTYIYGLTRHLFMGTPYSFFFLYHRGLKSTSGQQHNHRGYIITWPREQRALHESLGHATCELALHFLLHIFENNHQNVKVFLFVQFICFSFLILRKDVLIRHAPCFVCVIIIVWLTQFRLSKWSMGYTLLWIWINVT